MTPNKTHTTAPSPRVAFRLARFVALFAAATVFAADTGTQNQAKSMDDALNKCIKVLRFGDTIGNREPTKVDAVHALGLLGDERAVPVLVEHLENEPNHHLRTEIARALGWIGSPSAVPALEKTLADKYPHLRQQSAVALKKITGKDYDYDKTGLPTRESLMKDIEKRRQERETASGAAPTS
ncbi:MAG: HEAT repeat domain-containing protein [Nibricoccus sp.]